MIDKDTLKILEAFRSARSLFERNAIALQAIEQGQDVKIAQEVEMRSQRFNDARVTRYP
tara:strand:- start:514 stop:690 length:177 start_codon:yes stop_codon:yes gene_type:complete